MGTCASHVIEKEGGVHTLAVEPAVMISETDDDRVDVSQFDRVGQILKIKPAGSGVHEPVLLSTASHERLASSRQRKFSVLCRTPFKMR